MNGPTLDPKAVWLAVLTDALVALRSANNQHTDNVYWGKSRGLAELGEALGWITYAEFTLIDGLIDNASEHATAEARRHAA